jgi:FkbM family methyltransferase
MFTNGYFLKLPEWNLIEVEIDMKKEPELLSFGQKLCYRLLPMRLYASVRALRNLRRYEPELNVLPLLVDPDKTCVDAGANRGTYTYFLSKLAKHVYAYEPNPAMRWILQRSVGKNVSISNIALSDHNGEANFAVPKSKVKCHNNAGSLEVALLTESSEALVLLPVQTARLDDQGVSNVGFIKIDVEGHEREVLIGARQVIARDHPVLLIEMMESLAPGESSGNIAFVEQLGYQSFLLVGKRLVDYRLAIKRGNIGEGWDRRAPHLRSNNIIFLPVERQERMAA